MPKIKTSELIGPALDWAVAKANGYTTSDLDLLYDIKCYSKFKPSTDPSLGQPIMEREAMHVDCLRKPDHYRGAVWEAWPYASTKFIAQGPTMLIAGMRCYVASKLGDEVEVPEGLQS